ITGTLSGIIGSDDVIFNGTGTFADVNVANGIAVTSTSTLGGAKAGNYTLTQPTNLTGNITAKALTITAPSIASKIHDGNATSGTVTSGTLSGFVSPETVTINTAVGTYSDATVENGKTATIVYTLANGDNGGLAANYSLANGSAIGDITSASTAVDVTTSNNSDAVISGTTSDVTVSGTAVLTVNGVSCEVKSLATSTGTQVIVNSPLIVNTGGVTLAPNSILELANTATVTGNVEVGTGAKLKFTAATTLNVTGDLILKATETNTENTSFSANIGTGTLAVSGDIKYLKTIDDAKWYFVSFPSDVTISTITGSPALGTLGTNWFIKFYDGYRRGESGADGSNWIAITPANLATYPKLNKYQGYIIGLLSGSSEITFTLDKTNLSTETARSITVAANNAGAISTTNHGWNLIGQPYLSKYATNTGSNMTNIYKFNGTTYTDYHNDAYVQNLPIVDPFGAYFTKVTTGGSLSFGLGARQALRSSVSASMADVVFLDCTTASETDRTNIIMDDAQSANYQNGVDYEKMITTETATPQVYTVLGGLNYSYNVLPTSSVVNLPLAIYTKTTASTTISVDGTRAKSLSKLLLTDNGVIPATVTDLLSSNYTFTATAGTNNTRFAITAQRIATEIDKFDSNADAPKLSIINCQLSIENLSPNATVRVYDALGRMVVSKNATSNVMEIKLGAHGIYTVQLQSGTNISTRKVIF
ncbi:MAG: YDG domain-containing protein, partial [Paludibacter sp.]